MWRDAHACRGTRTPRVTAEEKQGGVREPSNLKPRLGHVGRMTTVPMYSLHPAP